MASTSLELAPRTSERLFGDLHELRSRGVIRIARQRWADFDSLPHEGIGLEHYVKLATDFAAAEGLAVDWVETDDFSSLLNAANDGVADLVIGNLSITASRVPSYGFTMPLSRSAEWLVGRRDVLEARLGVPAGTAYLDTAAAQGFGDMTALPSQMQPDQVLEAIAAGRIERTILDAVAARTLLPRFAGIEKLDELASRPMAWVVRADSTALRVALDAFIAESHMARQRLELERRDLPAIIEAGVLRVVTVTGPHTYFLYKGERMGFEYEMLKRYGDKERLLLELIVAPDRETAFDWLGQGRADVLAATMTDTAERRDRGWHFTDPYLYVEEVVVIGADGPEARNLDDLRGSQVVVNADSSHRTRLEALGLSPVAVEDDVVDVRLGAILHIVLRRYLLRLSHPRLACNGQQDLKKL